MDDMGPESVSNKMMLAAFYVSQEKLELALDWTNKALALEPDNLEIKNAIAALSLEMDKREDAENLIDEVLEKDRGNVRARFLKARLVLERKDYKGASI